MNVEKSLTWFVESMTSLMPLKLEQRLLYLLFYLHFIFILHSKSLQNVLSNTKKKHIAGILIKEIIESKQKMLQDGNKGL